MSVYRDARKWRDAFDARLDRLQANAVQAHRVLALEYKADMVRATSGTISEAELRRAGHPFGRTGPDGRMRGLAGSVKKGPGGRSRRAYVRKKYPLNPINRQTGRLQSSIKIIPYISIQHIQAYEIYASAPHARYVMHPLGTSKMVGRDVLTGHRLGRTAPAYLERMWRAKKRIMRMRYKAA